MPEPVKVYDLREPTGIHCPGCGWSSGGHGPGCAVALYLAACASQERAKNHAHRVRRLERLTQQVEELREVANAIPWWKFFERQDALRELKTAMHMAALNEVYVEATKQPIRDAEGDES